MNEDVVILKSIKLEFGFAELRDDNILTFHPIENIRTYNLKQLQALMRDYVGIVRSNKRLKRAITHLDLIYEEVEDLYRESKITTSLCELRNMINVAHLIIRQSLDRSENKGGYYNMDNVKH